MIEILPDFPGPAVAAAFSGQISSDDFDDVLIPAIIERRAAHDSLQLLLFFTSDFRRFTTTAAWDDKTVGLHHLDAYDKVAIVTDTAWIERLAAELSQSRPQAVRLFATAQLSAAKDWICK